MPDKPKFERAIIEIEQKLLHLLRQDFSLLRIDVGYEEYAVVGDDSAENRGRQDDRVADQKGRLRVYEVRIELSCILASVRVRRRGAEAQTDGTEIAGKQVEFLLNLVPFDWNPRRNDSAVLEQQRRRGRELRSDTLSRGRITSNPSQRRP